MPDDERDEYTRQWDELVKDHLRVGRTRGRIVGADAAIDVPHIEIPPQHGRDGWRLEGVKLAEASFMFSTSDVDWAKLVARELPLTWRVEFTVDESRPMYPPDPLYARHPPHTLRAALRWIKDVVAYGWKRETGRLKPYTLVERVTLHGVELDETGTFGWSE